MKVVLTLGDSPKDCYLEINGERVSGLTSVTASVSVEDGPKVKYIISNAYMGMDAVQEVEFNPVFIDKTYKEIFGGKK